MLYTNFLLNICLYEMFCKFYYFQIGFKFY